ncbi:MAG: hypothetical protein RLY71_1349 [Pseudomonadota bacterium]|jgi:hypothetical protein
MIHLRRIPGGLAVTALALLLAACGGGGDDGVLNASPGRGGLVKSPPTQLAALSATTFNASLQATDSGRLVAALAGAPVCDIDVRYLQYGTVGAQGEKVTATGAMYVPTGGTGCGGARPIVLYAHGTSVEKSFNMALLGSTNDAASEAAIVAATYAAHGYIVVAPNYAGYEASSLAYHPFLNADQQSKDMMDALTAARAALPAIANGTSDSGRLFITGYSEGGFVALATHRAMQAAGMTVTASAGQSGPYATSMQIDAVFSGQPSLAGTVFTPLITTSWQKAANPKLYDQPSDIYTSAYASGIDTLLPGSLTLSQLVASDTGKLPKLTFLGTDVSNYGQLTDVVKATFYGDPAKALIRTSYADAVIADILAHPCSNSASTPLDCIPAHPLRQAAKNNDLRTWTPARPVLLCGGHGDPTVFFANAQLTQAYFKAQQVSAGVPALGQAALVDVDSGVPTDAFERAVAGAGGLAAYHSTVAPFCNAAARTFFSQVP